MVFKVHEMHGTHGNSDVVKDHLDKVSGRLRKAVGLNRHEVGGLRNAVTQMNRERNRSVGILSKQQQDFMQKQAKLLPAIGIDKRRTRKSSNQVIPLDINEAAAQAREQQGSGGNSKGKASNRYSILPPIHRLSRGHKLDSYTNETEAKQKRISDYQKEFSSLQESISNAYKFANSQVPAEDHGEEDESAARGSGGSGERRNEQRKHHWQQTLDSFEETDENGLKLNTLRSSQQQISSPRERTKEQRKSRTLQSFEGTDKNGLKLNTLSSSQQQTSSQRTKEQRKPRTSLQSFEESDENGKLNSLSCSQQQKSSPRGSTNEQGKHRIQQALHSFEETGENSRKVNTSNCYEQLPKGDVKSLNTNTTVGEIDTQTAIKQHTSRVRDKEQPTERQKSMDEIDRVAIENEPSLMQQRIPYNHWNTVRGRLKSIASMNKKRHSQFLDQLYEDIRNCRYIRNPRRRKDSESEDDAFA